jgi:hypothetical protein|tara:strand:- start:3980 stop:5389 length:1410 start_codon:yes stop_codon:yes gene_type:complete
MALGKKSKARTATVKETEKRETDRDTQTTGSENLNSGFSNQITTPEGWRDDYANFGNKFIDNDGSGYGAARNQLNRINTTYNPAFANESSNTLAGMVANQGYQAPTDVTFQNVSPGQVYAQNVSAQQAEAQQIAAQQIGSQQIAAQQIEAQQIAAQQIAAQRGLDLSGGYENRYTDNVVNRTLGNYDVGTNRAANAFRAQSIAGGQGGNARQSLAAGVAAGEAARNRAATEAGLRSAAQDRAFGYGMSDADRYMTSSQANQRAALTASQANQNAGLTAAQANQAAGLTAGQANQNDAFRAAQSNQAAGLTASQANQQAALAASQSNADQSYNIAMANAANNMAAQEYNVSQDLAAQQYNTGQDLVTQQYNQGRLDSRQMFDADMAEQGTQRRMDAVNNMEQNIAGQAALGGAQFDQSAGRLDIGSRMFGEEGTKFSESNYDEKQIMLENMEAERKRKEKELELTASLSI